MSGAFGMHVGTLVARGLASLTSSDGVPFWLVI